MASNSSHSDEAAPPPVEVDGSIDGTDAASASIEEAPVLERRGTSDGGELDIMPSELGSDSPQREMLAREMLAECSRKINDMMQQALKSLMEGAFATGPAKQALSTGHVRADLEAGVSESFDSFRNGVLKLISNVSEWETQGKRRSNRAQSHWFQLKLLHARKAGKVALEQHTMKMEAAYQERMLRLMDEARSEVRAQIEASAARCASAEAEVERLRAEAAGAKESVERILTQLNITVDKNRTLEETVKELVDSAAALSAERDELREEEERLRAVNEALSAESGRLPAVLEENASLREESERMRLEIDARAEAFEARMREREAELEGGSLAVHNRVAELEQEIEGCRTQIGRALAELSHMIEERAELQSEVATLGDENESLKSENDGLSRQNRTLSQQLGELMERVAADRAQLKDALRRTEEEGSREAAQEIELLKQERARLTADKAELQHEIEGLREQAAATASLLALRDQFSHAETAVEKVTEELRLANIRTMRAEEESKVERAALVKAALLSLQQLKRHLVETLSGLREKTTPADEGQKDARARMTEPGLDGFKWNPSKHRWGLSDADYGIVDSVVVRLELPPQVAGASNELPPAQPPAQHRAQSVGLPLGYLPPHLRTANYVPMRPTSARQPAAPPHGLRRPRTAMLQRVGSHRGGEQLSARARLQRIEAVDRSRPPPLSISLAAVPPPPATSPKVPLSPVTWTGASELAAVASKV